MHATDILIKLYGEHFHFSQSVFLRFFSASIILVPALLIKKYRRKIAAKGKNHNILIRSLFLCLATCFWFYGVPKSSITNVTAIAFFIPIMTLLFSSLWLKERVTFLRLVSNIVGFVGVAVIVGFNHLDANYGSLFLLLGSVFFALFAVASKKCASEESILKTLFFTSILAAGITLPITLFVWQPLSNIQLAVFLSLGLLANLNSFFLLKAYQFEDAAFLSPFLYIEMVFSIISGIFIFDEAIVLSTVLGSLLIVLSNLSILYEGQAKQH